MHGILVILKPPGMTSHDVVVAVRRCTNQRRVGHTGTLDPGAAGVLVLCMGDATRFIPFMEEYVKGYRAELFLGRSTDTQDAGGQTLAEKREFALTDSDMLEAFQAFQGEIQQIPPMVSALKHKGQRLYQLARRGQVVDRKPRSIHIYRLIPVGNWQKPAWRFGHTLMYDTLCSKGTYIRTLCEDIGEYLGVPTHMSFLLRTQVGPWRLEHAVTLEEFTAGVAKLQADENQPPFEGCPPLPGFFPVDRGVGHLPGAIFDLPDAKRLRQGGRLREDQVLSFCAPDSDLFAATGTTATEESLLRLYNVKGQFLGIGQRQRGADQIWKIRPVRMLPS